MNNSKKKRATVIQPDTIAGEPPTASPAKYSSKGAEENGAKVRRQPRQGKAGSVLRNSDRPARDRGIAQACRSPRLYTAIHGSVAGVKLVAELTGAMNLPPRSRPGRKSGPDSPLAQRLALGPVSRDRLGEIGAARQALSNNRRLNPHLNPGLTTPTRRGYPHPRQNTPSSLFPLPYSLFPLPSSLFPLPSSLFPLPHSLFLIPYSLFPIPCSLTPPAPIPSESAPLQLRKT